MFDTNVKVNLNDIIDNFLDIFSDMIDDKKGIQFYHVSASAMIAVDISATEIFKLSDNRVCEIS